MLGRLMREHDHLRRTLNLLEVQFLDLCRGKTPDTQLMLSIVVYVQEHPEKVHHPTEDALFSALIARGGAPAEIARKLIKDHTAIEHLTRKLRKTLETLLASRFVPETDTDLKQQLSLFLSRQRQHLHSEELEIYPQVERCLTQHDLDEIEAMAPRQEDPVFGERTRPEYRRLYAEIEDKHGQEL